MGKKFKKSLALLLAVVMLLGALPISAMAEEPVENGETSETEAYSAESSQENSVENGETSETEVYSAEQSQEKSAKTASKATIEITSPESGDTIEGNKNLTVKWEAVDGASFYLFTAKNLSTEEYITERENLGKERKYKISADDLPYDSSFRFWVGAFDKNGEQIAGSDVTYVVYTSAETTGSSISGSFGKNSYTMVVGETLDVEVNASATNASLTRVTINVDSSSNDRLTSREVSGSSWNGALTLDGSVAPLNVPGTYTIKLFAAIGDGSDEWAEVDQATLIVTEPDEETEKLADPVVTVKVDGTTMTATWNAVEGAARYVYSLRNLTDDQLIAEHADTNGCSIALNLEGGKQYKLAVGAVPAGVVDTKADKDLLSWKEVTFEIAAEKEETEKLPAPVVTVKVVGTTMTATWNAVEGAARYVYSLRNLTEDQLIANHEATNDCSVVCEFEYGKEYKLAVAAVPEGVSDTQEEADKCSWSEKTFKIEAYQKLQDPAVDVSIDGNMLLATWNEVDGAVRYVFSLRQIVDGAEGDFLYEYEEAVDRSIYLPLEYDKEYKLAVAAVPADVKDTQAESDKCAWTVKYFKTEAAETLMSKILSVDKSAVAEVVQPNETVTLTVVCNRATEYLDVYPFGDSDKGYQTLKDYVVGDYGTRIFEVPVQYSTSGKYKVRLVPMNVNKDDWSQNKEYWGYADIVVCDHTLGEPVLNGKITYIATGISTSKTHGKETPYRKSCVCGENYEEYTVKEEEEHTNSEKQSFLEKEHIKDKGHVEYYVCVCGDHPYTGNYIAYKRDLGRNGTCSVCRATYLKITDIQTMLKALGYYSDKIDGLWGSNTKKAMKEFYKAINGADKTFASVNSVDDTTYDELKKEYGKFNLSEQPIVDETLATSAMDELESILKNNEISNDLFNQLSYKAAEYLREGKISQEQYDQFNAFLSAEHKFDSVFGLETANTKYVLNPENGSIVGAKVLSKEIGEKVSDFVGSAVFDSYQSALDPFFEEFGQTMDVFAEEFEAENKQFENEFLEFFEKITLNSMIEKVLTEVYGEDVAEQILEGKKKLEETTKNWDSIKGAFEKQEIAEAERLYKAMFGKNEYFVMITARVLDIDTGEIGTQETLIDVKSYINNEVAEIKRQQSKLETKIMNLLESKITGGNGKQITAEDIDGILKNLGNIADGIDNASDFYKLLTSRLNMDREKVISFCDMLDSCEGLTDELNAARRLLRAEVSTDMAEKLGAIIAEYAMNLAVKEVGKAAVKTIEHSTGLDASPVYATMKATAAACNLTMGTKGVVSNTRGMTAQYENYASMYNNYIRLRKLCDANPNNSQMRQNAENALILALLFNLEADEYYLKMADSMESSFANSIAELVTGQSNIKLDELKEMINTEIENRETLLKFLK